MSQKRGASALCDSGADTQPLPGNDNGGGGNGSIDIGGNEGNDENAGGNGGNGNDIGDNGGNGMGGYVISVPLQAISWQYQKLYKNGFRFSRMTCQQVVYKLCINCQKVVAVRSETI